MSKVDTFIRDSAITKDMEISGKPALLIDNADSISKIGIPIVKLRKGKLDGTITHGTGNIQVAGTINFGDVSRLEITDVGLCDLDIRGSAYDMFLRNNASLSTIYKIMEKTHKPIRTYEILGMSEDELKEYLGWSKNASDLGLSEIQDGIVDISNLDIDSSFSTVLINGYSERDEQLVKNVFSYIKLPVTLLVEGQEPLSRIRFVHIPQSLFDIVDNRYRILTDTDAEKGIAKHISLITRGKI